MTNQDRGRYVNTDLVPQRGPKGEFQRFYTDQDNPSSKIRRTLIELFSEASFCLVEKKVNRLDEKDFLFNY